MINELQIRPEQEGDIKAIRELVTAAFSGQAHSSGTEATIVDQLRKNGELALSLVASDKGKIVGHIAFSPVMIGGKSGGWYGLGPLSVCPKRQRKGIGSMLVNQGLSQLSALGAAGCVLVGDPEYYGRFGFRSDCGLSYGDLPEKYVQGLAFNANLPGGEVRYSPAFEQ